MGKKIGLTVLQTIWIKTGIRLLRLPTISLKIVKKTANGFEGITVEGDAYQSYLNDENAPVGNQVITFVPQAEIDNLTWSCIDNAIDFYEGVYKNTANEESKI